VQPHAVTTEATPHIMPTNLCSRLPPLLLLLLLLLPPCCLVDPTHQYNCTVLALVFGPLEPCAEPSCFTYYQIRRSATTGDVVCANVRGQARNVSFQLQLHKEVYNSSLHKTTMEKNCSSKQTYSCQDGSCQTWCLVVDACCLSIACVVCSVRS
jgi:hypothetical protein